MAADTVVPASDVVSRERIFHYLAWGPVIVGAIGAAAISFVLYTFGSALGLAAVSPYIAASQRRPFRDRRGMCRDGAGRKLRCRWLSGGPPAHAVARAGGKRAAFPRRRSWVRGLGPRPAADRGGCRLGSAGVRRPCPPARPRHVSQSNQSPVDGAQRLRRRPALEAIAGCRRPCRRGRGSDGSPGGHARRHNGS